MVFPEHGTNRRTSLGLHSYFFRRALSRKVPFEFMVVKCPTSHLLWWVVLLSRGDSNAWHPPCAPLRLPSLPLCAFDALKSHQGDMYLRASLWACLYLTWLVFFQVAFILLLLNHPGENGNVSFCVWSYHICPFESSCHLPFWDVMLEECVVVSSLQTLVAFAVYDAHDALSPARLSMELYKYEGFFFFN